MQRLRTLATRAAVPAAIALAALLPLAAHWLSGRTLVWLDTQSLYAPQRWLVDEALRDLRLPLWNPHSGTGMPFFAEAMHGVLHPISVVVAWLGTSRSADLLIGGYVVAAALGAAWLARELGASWGAAALAALTYALSGFVLSMAGNLVFLAGAGSLPFCVAGLLRAGRVGDLLGVVGGTLGAATLAFSGDAQVLMIGGPLGVLLAWGAGRWRGLARAGGAGLLGLLVASVQLVPSAVHFPRTSRAFPVSRGVELAWPLEPSRLPELLLPGLFHGEDQAYDALYAALVGPGHWPAGTDPIPFAASIFVGLLPVALALAGAWEDRRGRLLGGCAVVLGWVAMGTTLGAHAVLRHVPIWKSFRYMEKVVGPLTLLLALLAALGADAAARDRRVAGRALAAALLLGAVAFAGGWWVRGGLGALDGGVFADRLVRGAGHAVLAALFLLGWTLLQARIPERLRVPLLAAAAWVGAVAAAPDALRPGDPAARLEAPAPRLAAGPTGPRVANPYIASHPDWPHGPGFIDSEGRHYSALAAPAYNVRDRIDNLDEYSGMVPLRLLRLRLMLNERWEWAARRYSVTHVLLDRPLTEDQVFRGAKAVEGADRLPSAAEGVEVWATTHRPWASFPRTLRVVGDETTAFTQTLAVIDERIGTAVVVADAPLSVSQGRVISAARGTERVRIEAESQGAGTLVVTDAWWPGWEARIDGREVPIYLADSLVRAVPWPAGRHVLEMAYRPPEVRAGLLLSLLGVLILAAWVAAASGALDRLRRRPPSCSRG
jgi:hypothetical protein